MQAPMRVWRGGVALLAVVSALWGAGPVQAQDAAAPAPSQSGPVATEATTTQGGDVLEGTKFAGEDRLTLPGVIFGGGVMVLDRDGGSAQTFTQLGLRSEFAVWRLSFALHLSLNVGHDFQFRREDTDEPSDWPNFIESISFDRPGGLFHARVGRLFGARLGHGTLLDHYQSAIDRDSQHVGVQLELNLDHLGAQFLTNDIAGYEVTGGRIYLDPLTGIGIPILRSARVSVQAVVDAVTPASLKTDPQTGVTALDGDNNLRYTADTFVAFGMGVELPLLESPVKLTPYADLNFLSGAGSGLHLGAEAGFQLPIFSGVGILGQAEFRVMDNQYLPVYFDAQYEVQRFAYPDVKSPQTKREALREIGAQNGYMVRAGVKLPFLEASLQYEGLVESKGQNRLVLGAEITGLPYIRARALLTKTGANTLPRTFSFDDQTTLVIETLIDLNRYIFLDLSLTRTFRVDPGKGRYEPVDTYSPAVMIGWLF